MNICSCTEKLKQLLMGLKSPLHKSCFVFTSQNTLVMAIVSTYKNQTIVLNIFYYLDSFETLNLVICLIKF